MSVVVGVDGSIESWAALAWAKEASHRRSVPLVVVIAADDLVEVEDGRPGDPAEIASRTSDLAPEAEVRVVEGIAEDVLLSAALGAQALVIGSRGMARFTAFIADSVSTELIGHTAAPVVLVRSDAPTSTGRVVVGIDPESGAQVLPFACAEASLRGAQLRVVSTWESSILTTFGATAVSNEAISARISGELEALLIPLQDRYPDLDIATVVEFGDPAAALVDEARQADLVVVGSGKHGAIVGLLRGSVAQTLVHEVTVPVAVVSTREN